MCARSKTGGISVTEAEKRARDVLAKAGVPTQAEVLHVLKAVPVKLTDTRKNAQFALSLTLWGFSTSLI